MVVGRESKIKSHPSQTAQYGVWSTIGSTNLDWLNMERNQEINTVVLGQEFGAQMKALFNKDTESSQHVILEKWRQRPIVIRLKELGARLVARWL